jgi:hypothetical protein
MPSEAVQPPRVSDQRWRRHLRRLLRVVPPAELVDAVEALQLELGGATRTTFAETTTTSR